MTKLMLVATIASLSIVTQGLLGRRQLSRSLAHTRFTIPMATCCTLDPASMARAPNPTEQLASAIRGGRW